MTEDEVREWLTGSGLKEESEESEEEDVSGVCGRCGVLWGTYGSDDECNCSDLVH